MEPHSSSQHIIAIGASAGGIEAIYSFFDNTPVDKVSYVIVQHLSVTHKSRMAELLAKHSKLKICEVENHMLVKENLVYLVPHNKYMTIRDRRLQLTDKQEHERPHLTINTFFTSLALDIGNKAIGVILSGTGNDGVVGIEAIKKAGGMVMVQDPDTAKYDGMPQSAIATGFTDIVLAPQAMPECIQNYVKGLPWNPTLPVGNGRELPSTDDFGTDTPPESAAEEMEESQLMAILHIIEGHLPLDFSDYKRATLRRRISRRMAHHHISYAEAYVSFLTHNPPEIEALAKDFMIRVTSFFRNPEAFKTLEKEIIPAIVGHHAPEAALKLWVAGCATGEEAYSIAILVREYLDRMGKPMEVKLFATDIDKAALGIASKGVYPESIAEDIASERLEQFFTREAGSFKVKPHIRQMLIFAQHDLVSNPPYCNMDLISCRNLLIYMNPALQKKIFSMLYFGLRPGGYLFLGASENASILKPYMEEVDRKWKLYKKTDVTHKIRFDTFSAPILEKINPIATPPAKPATLFAKKNTVSNEINEAILSELAEGGLCIDEQYKVVEVFGDVSKYLLPNMFNFNLLELLPKPLSIAFGAAVHKALKMDKRVIIQDIRMESGEKEFLVNLLVKPFISKKTSQQLILVLFSEEKRELIHESAGKKKATEPFDQYFHTSEYFVHLEDELKETRERLMLANEKLEASQENMQSFNEELLSASEEMQSANEELQSVNEELQTINTEHQMKIKELTQLNDDMNNYFRSNVNGQLFVDKDLLLLKFSPATISHINLREADIGRPLQHITTNIKFETLIVDIKNVIATGEVIAKEVQAVTGKYYHMMTMPYILQEDNKIDGAIITFYDITELKSVQRELDISNQSLLRINADLNNFVYSASHDLLGPIASIEGLLHLVKGKMDAADPKVQEYTQMLDHSLATFRASIKELAVIGKIEGEMLLAPDVISLNKLLEEITFSIQDKITASGATIIAEFEVAEITFSKKNLRSLLYNLLSNALKFKADGRNPHIMVRTVALPGFIVLSVQDNGMGIPADKVDSIFTMYRRLNQMAEGQGIGLYLLKKIIDAAGGSVEVASEVDKGTTFKLFFKH